MLVDQRGMRCKTHPCGIIEALAGAHFGHRAVQRGTGATLIVRAQ
jgi:hypothetical protein